MKTGLSPLFLILLVLFILQGAGGYFQIRNYKASVHRIRQYGIVGIGQRRGWFFSSYLCLITCDQEGIITRCEVMDGASFLARFHEKKQLMGETLAGTSVESWMNRFSQFDKRKFKQYRGYIQAMDALCKRLHPERYSEEELTVLSIGPDREKFEKIRREKDLGT